MSLWLVSFQINGKLVAVDATKEKKVSSDFGVKGYPTLKYFKDGEFAFDVSSLREKDKIVDFMTNPKVRSIGELRYNATRQLQPSESQSDSGGAFKVFSLPLKTKF